MAVFCRPSTDGALRQGEVLSHVRAYAIATDSLDADGELVVNPSHHQHVIVLSQDCDLDWDFRATQSLREGGTSDEESANLSSRKLEGVLLCDVFEATEIHGAANVNKRVWDRIKINKDDRYHFIEGVEPRYDRQGEGLPEMVLDFKKYFTLAPELLYWQIERGDCYRRVRLDSPYLEHLSHRFSCFMSRVGLPEDYKSMPES